VWYDYESVAGSVYFVGLKSHRIYEKKQMYCILLEVLGWEL